MGEVERGETTWERRKGYGRQEIGEDMGGESVDIKEWREGMLEWRGRGGKEEREEKEKSEGRVEREDGEYGRVEREYRRVRREGIWERG